MPILIGWKILNLVGYSVLTGYIYGDTEYKNGTPIVTNKLLRIDIDETIAYTDDKEYALRHKRR